MKGTNRKEKENSPGVDKRKLESKQGSMVSWRPLVEGRLVGWGEVE